MDWRAIARHRKSYAVTRRHRTERLIPLSPVEEIRIRTSVVYLWTFRVARVRRANDYQPLRFGIRQRPEQHRIDDTENRSVGADSQRQRQYRNQCEARILRQHSCAVAQVLPYVFEPSHTASVAAPLLRLLHPSENFVSRGPRL